MAASLPADAMRRTTPFPPECSPLVLALLLQPPGVAGEFLRNGVTAHRGSSLEHPENTLSAFRHALDLGVDWIELDIFTTRDGHLVVNHDATTGRTAGRDLTIADSTLAELRELDMAHEFRRSRGRSEAQCPRETIPLLGEAIGLVTAQRRTRLSIQPKDESVAAAVALIREKGAAAWCGFNDGSLEKMTEVKRLMPELRVFWDRPARCDLEGDLRIASERGFEALVIHHEGITPERIAAVRKAGREVGAWTVNDPAAMKRLLGWGIDRLYTDDPRRLLAMKGARRE